MSIEVLSINVKLLKFIFTSIQLSYMFRCWINIEKLSIATNKNFFTSDQAKLCTKYVKKLALRSDIPLNRRG